MTVLLQWILCGVAGYLLGNIQTGLIVARLSGNVDLRKHGSGSSGATNALRVLGRQQAVITLLGDGLKAIAAVCTGLLIAGQRGGMIAAVCVTAGHIWPVFYGFRGGKGIATSIGSLLVLMPIQAAIFLVFGILVILITRMVSVGSISGALLFMILAAIEAAPNRDWFLLVFGIIVAALIVYAHRGNIKRISDGTENRISASMFQKKKEP